MSKFTSQLRSRFRGWGGEEGRDRASPGREPLQDRRKAAEFEGDAELVLSKLAVGGGGGRGGRRRRQEGQGVSHVVAADHVAGLNSKARDCVNSGCEYM